MKKLKTLLRREYPFMFATPALMWQFFFLYLPLAGLFLYSFLVWPQGATVPGFTLQHYKALFDILYLQVIGNSFFLATTTAFFCLLVGFPIAYFLALKVKRFKTLLLVFLILPSWTSFIVQVYAWFFLLEKGSVLSSLVYMFGFTAQPVHLLNTTFSTLIGMVYCYMPFMIFPIYAVLERLDATFLESSADLGANRFQTLRYIIVPLARPGIITGLLLVFIPAFGEFVIPELLGGVKNVYVGNVIVDKFVIYNNWQSAAAWVFSALVSPLIIIVSLMVLYGVMKHMVVKVKKRGGHG